MLIREARVTDVIAMAKVHVDSWRTTYKDILPDDFLANLSYERSAERFVELFRSRTREELIYLAEENTMNIAGFAVGGRERSGSTLYRGEVYATYLLKEYQRKGIGSELFKAIARGLHRHDIDSLIVWVLADNPACHFYEAMGGKQVDEKLINLGGQQLKEIAYGWQELTSLVVDGGS